MLKRALLCLNLIDRERVRVRQNTNGILSQSYGSGLITELIMSYDAQSLTQSPGIGSEFKPVLRLNWYIIGQYGKNPTELNCVSITSLGNNSQIQMTQYCLQFCCTPNTIPLQASITIPEKNSVCSVRKHVYFKSQFHFVSFFRTFVMFYKHNFFVFLVRGWDHTDYKQFPQYSGLKKTIETHGLL